MTYFFLWVEFQAKFALTVYIYIYIYIYLILSYFIDKETNLASILTEIYKLCYISYDITLLCSNDPLNADPV